MIPVVIGSEVWGETPAVASELGRERIVLQVRADEILIDSIVTVHIGEGGSEMVARARVASAEDISAVGPWRFVLVLEVLDWDDCLGCLLPSEKGEPT